jgi:hypothetical protein
LTCETEKWKKMKTRFLEKFRQQNKLIGNISKSWNHNVWIRHSMTPWVSMRICTDNCYICTACEDHKGKKYSEGQTYVHGEEEGAGPLFECTCNKDSSLCGSDCERIKKRMYTWENYMGGFMESFFDVKIWRLAVKASTLF